MHSDSDISPADTLSAALLSRFSLMIEIYTSRSECQIGLFSSSSLVLRFSSLSQRAKTFMVLIAVKHFLEEGQFQAQAVFKSHVPSPNHGLFGSPDGERALFTDFGGPFDS